MDWSGVILTGVIGASCSLITWHCATAHKLYGEDFVAFRASSCGRAKPRRNVLGKAWGALIGPVIRYAEKQWGKL